MNVLHISTSDNIGGAARACLNISTSLNSIGINSRILAQQKRSRINLVYDINSNFIEGLKTNARVLIDYALIKLLTIENRGRFTFPIIGTEIFNNSLIQNSDILNLHWINGGFFSLKTLEALFNLNKPIVWTFHDMWAFTGGCHYTGDCNNYLTYCKKCPSLRIRGEKDFSQRTFKSKEKLFQGKKFTIVTCSNWLAKEANQSYLLHNYNVNVIPNPIDTEVFQPYPKNEVRKQLKIPQDKIIILFSSFTVNEKRKGFQYLKDSLSELYKAEPNLVEKLELVILGSINEEILNDVPFKTNKLGRVGDNKMMALYYSAADLFIAPSLQENLSNTVMESLACGTPVLSFNIGGMPDMIGHEENGYLASQIGAKELLSGIIWFINLNNDSKRIISINARKKVIDNFSQKHIANQYKNLYQELLKSN